MSPSGFIADAHTSRANYVLLALLVVYTLNFADRQMIAILLPLIKAEMGVSDAQLGLLTGLAFSLTYSVLAIPAARIADRHSRVAVLAAAVAVWSLFTLFCGRSTTFTGLFVSRLGVGIGEAGFAAPAYAIISDYFPPRERSRALAIFALGAPFGSAAGLMGGAALGDQLGWRYAFVVIGILGLIISVFFFATVPEPSRGRLDKDDVFGTTSFIQALAYISKKRAFWGLVTGASLSSALIYGLAFWLPTYFVREFHQSIRTVSLVYGAQTLVGASIGLIAGGFLGDRLGPRRPGSYALIPAGCFALAIPFYALALSVNSPLLASTLLVVPTALSFVWIGPVLTALQGLAPSGMRSTVSAVFLMVQNLVGMGGGAYMLGFLSDHLTMRFGADALRYSILYSLSLFAISAVVYTLTASSLEKDLAATAVAH